MEMKKADRREEREGETVFGFVVYKRAGITKIQVDLCGFFSFLMAHLHICLYINHLEFLMC